MPTSVTHQLLAEEVYKALPEEVYEKIGSLQHYYLGAQGCDICFAYHPLLTLGDNLGQYAHAVCPQRFFQILKENAQSDPFVRSYAFGYVTHYAADTVFHPYLFEKMGGKDGFFTHHSYEHSFDGELLRMYRGDKLRSFSLPKMHRLQLGGVFRVYKQYAKECGYPFLLREGAFYAAVKTYLFMSKARLPLYRKKRAEMARVLFEESKQKSVELCAQFSRGLIQKGFDRNFLTGKEQTNCEKCKIVEKNSK